MPLEELLALYYHGENQENESPVQSEPLEEQGSESDPPERSSKLSQLYGSIPENDQDASRLLRCESFYYLFISMA